MGRPLKQLLERNCELMYHMHMPLRDIEMTDSTELNFIHGWLVNQKKKEADAMNPKKGNAHG